MQTKLAELIGQILQLENTMDKETWPTVVLPITLEEDMTAEVYQTENGIPLLKINVTSLDCAIYITVDAALALGDLASRVKGLYDHSLIH